MTFTAVCPTEAIHEGAMRLFQVGKRSVLLVWPAGGELRAYRGRCPHADLPLDQASLDGNRLTCELHGFGFDCTSGKCVTHVGVRNALQPFELRVEGGEVLVDVGPGRPAKAPT